jgi:uncharacterized protein (DUF1697 family)
VSEPRERTTRSQRGQGVRYVAFLRAINVGGHIVKMDVLKKAFVRLGYQDVDTFIASGNVIFSSRSTDTAKLERQIEAQLKRDLGYEVATFIRTADEVVALSAYQSFPAAEIAAARVHYVGFVREPLTEAVRSALLEFATELESFQARGREWFWLTRASAGESKISNGAIEKALKVRSTLRGMNTIVRLAGRLQPKPAYATPAGWAAKATRPMRKR